MSQQSPYQILGEEGIRKLAHTFYDVMDELPQVEKVRKMHAVNKDEIKQKLTDYLTGWMGGPPRYQEKTGTVCLTEPHKPYAIGPEERDQWLLCMDIALERTGASDELKQMLKTPMFRIADTIRNRETSEQEVKDPNIIAAG
ncbi:group II truncated hemoglobin [Parahaliea sp. F7430]|uniref:Group II truncated hemoglobin n=1 Tax=Sediminihaliea albiluteola TaxID=2758564 RepID=A0A7W2TWM5_9GAMM|nr:group II truncated hemoglobin [Sediminihaliea albiluteola]MBA6413174.1 group II truncated hemoglobin [Sediminihaliea albiluteola]